MDEILQQIEEIFLSARDVERQMEDDFKVFKSKIDGIVAGNKEINQTPQQKKKAKRLSIIIDGEENDKISSQTSVQEDWANVEIDGTRCSGDLKRPARAAKLKVESMKQPTLREKLRRPDGDDTLSTSKSFPKISGINAEAVKKKLDARTTTSNDRSNNSSNHSAKRSSNINSNEDDVQNDIKKIDESLLIVSNGEVPIVELSEDEADKIMPPPSEIPKKKVIKSKQSEGSEISKRSLRLRIKKEKISIEKQAEKVIDYAADKAEPVSEPIERRIQKDDETVQECKVEVEEGIITKVNTKKTKKGKKPLKCMPIKEEKPDENKSKEGGEQPAIINKEKNKPSSLESVYEDAVAYNVGEPSLSIEPQQNIPRINTVVAVEKVRVSATTRTEIITEMPADATFVSAKDAPVPETNTTFVTSSSPQQIFVMDTNNLSNDLDRNKTQIISTNHAGHIDATFSINNETFQTQPAERNHDKQQQHEIMHSSIMTEEDFGDELMPPPQPTSAKIKSKKELFNPCIQSPVKKKVEAFEKHAHASASPLIQRQTRTKTKAKENTDPETPHTFTKLNTPALLKRDVGKLLTPTLQSNITPTIGILQATKYLASSTSKLTQVHKSSAKSSTISKTQSLSRENSVEDVRRGGYSKLQQLADEKKKKRELKQQQAAQTREAKEKERADKLKKAMQEREEKLRRKAQEIEHKKQLEEINKNLKLQEEKREAQKRMERKQLEMEMAEAARKERLMLDNMKVQKTREELQQKLLHNQKLLEQKKAKKAEKQGLKYDFNLLNSDDSTDDEGKTNSKRPLPPVWSKSTIRHLCIERQAHLNTKIIDSVFSVQPMTPDLKEIFPTIDPRYLKRNSSVFWNTPPRYSQLPKY